MNEVTRTWRVGQQTADRINALADEMETFPSTLVDMLLDRALRAVAAGDWRVTRRPIRYSLHWGEGGARGIEER